MDIATFRALSTYGSVAAALAAKPTNGDAWLLNETLIYQDGSMSNPAPSGAAIKKSNQTQKAQTKISTDITRNKGNAGVTTYAINGGILGTTANYTYNTSVGGAKQSSLTDAAHKEVTSADKGPAVRHKVSWYVTDNTQSAGYRRVFGLLESAGNTSPYRDDDAQVRI
jgi:hypothetical protein